MQFKILGFAIGIAIIAFIGITMVMVRHASRPDMPPLVGAVSKFSPTMPAAPEPVGSFVDGNGKKLDLSAFKGKLTLVNFWATWCAPCVAELPSIERLKRDHAKDNFDVETISEDAGGKVAIEEFFKKDNLAALPEYVDTAAAYSELLKLKGLPTTILLDPNGNELGRYEGDTAWDSPEALQMINWYLARLNPQPHAAG